MEEANPIIRGENGLLYKAETILRHRNRITEIRDRKARQKLESQKIQRQKQKVPKSDVKKPEDLSPLLLRQVSHFFEHYKDLEPNKWVKVEGWLDADAAKAEILVGVKRYQQSSPKPNF